MLQDLQRRFEVVTVGRALEMGFPGPMLFGWRVVKLPEGQARHRVYAGADRTLGARGPDR